MFDSVHVVMTLREINLNSLAKWHRTKYETEEVKILGFLKILKW